MKFGSQTPKTSKTVTPLTLGESLHSHSYQKSKLKWSSPILKPFWKQATSHQTCQREKFHHASSPLLLPNSPSPHPTPMGLSQTKGTGSAKATGKTSRWHTVNLAPSHAIASLQKKRSTKLSVFFQQEWF